MAENKFTVSGEQHFGIDGQMLEIKSQLRRKGGSPINPILVQRALQDIIEGRFSTKAQGNKILKLFSEESMVIEPCDGTEILLEAKEVFAGGICNQDDFRKWNLVNPVDATKETVVQVYETIVDEASYLKVFDSLSQDLNKLCLSQHQIKIFCKKYPNWLSPNEKTYFLFKSVNEFFVAKVDFFEGRLTIHPRRLMVKEVHDYVKSVHVVVPQLVD